MSSQGGKRTQLPAFALRIQKAGSKRHLSLFISDFRGQWFQLLFDFHDDCVSKQFVNDAVSVTVLATCWHEVPLPPLEGEVVER